MPTFFDPTPEERHALEAIARQIPDVQRGLVRNHPQLTMPDRGAHQQQLAGSKVLLTTADSLPAELDGLGIFQRSSAPRIGIGRMSTGLGCPHAETNADFLGLMVAFRTAAGRRVDFVTINDPTSPTDTPEEFLALLKATADASSADDQLASQTKLVAGLLRHAGRRAPAIALHVTGQTFRTVRSTSAYQQYWTGIVRARDVLGKFTFVPTGDVRPRPGATHGATHLTDDWRARQGAGPLEFDLKWIRFLNENDTSLVDLTKAWESGHAVTVGRVTFPQTNFDSSEARLRRCWRRSSGPIPATGWRHLPVHRRRFRRRGSPQRVNSRTAPARRRAARYQRTITRPTSSAVRSARHSLVSSCDAINRSVPQVTGCRLLEICRSREAMT